MKISTLDKDIFKQYMQNGIYWITKCIAVGPYADREKRDLLQAQKVTHVLNVGRNQTDICRDLQGFVDQAWHPITDLQRIPNESVVACLDIMHAFLQQPDSKIYVHCVAGQNRSPSIIWLYLIACGLTPKEATKLIDRGALDAIPGHPKLVDSDHILLVQQYGKENFLPLPYPQIIEPSGK